MLGTIDVEIQALNPNMPLHPWCAYVNSPSSLRLRNVPKRIGDWHITSVKIVAIYPNSEIKTAECVLTGGIWVGTVAGTSTSGTSQNGYTIVADGIDENNQPVTGYVLGKGDITILEADGTLSPDPARYYVKLLSAEAEQPREGDMYPTSDGYVIWQNGQANQLGTPFEQITAYVESQVSSKAEVSSVEAVADGVEDLSNSLSDYYTKGETSSNVELGTKFTTKADLSTLSDYIPFAIDKNGDKTAITIGVRAGGQPVGIYSFSNGSNNVATGLNSLVVGSFNNAVADNAVAIGAGNFATAVQSLAVGNSNSINGSTSIGIGNSNAVSGNYSVAIGHSNHVEKIFGIALGTRATALDSGCYVWNGTNKTRPIGLTEYTSHGVGTFNINPVGGLSGVYVGETNLGNYMTQLETQALTLSSDPYVGGWRIELSRPQGGDGGATFVGRVMSDSGKNVLLNGTLVETDIAALEDYIDEQYNLWLIGNYLSAVKDGAKLSSGIGYHMLEFNDLYWFAAGDYPRDNMRTNFGMARLYRR